MNRDGTFTYTPAVGFAGPSDTFTYTLTDGNGMTNTAMVTINLSEVVWYVNFSSTNGDGRSHSPFNTLNNAQTPSADGHTIFVHTGAATIPDGIVLKLWPDVVGAGDAVHAQRSDSRGDGEADCDRHHCACQQRDREFARHQHRERARASPIPTIPRSRQRHHGCDHHQRCSDHHYQGTAVSLSDTGGALTFERISADGVDTVSRPPTPVSRSPTPPVALQ